MKIKEIKNETLEKETTRLQNLTDLFVVKCKKCGSENVGLIANDCHECGITIDAECWDCGSKYCYHDFKQIRIRYSGDGKTETVLGEVQ